MKKWSLACSIDGGMIDYEEVIESEKEPDFWTCHEIAEEHDCELWVIEEVKI